MATRNFPSHRGSIRAKVCEKSLRFSEQKTPYLACLPYLTSVFCNESNILSETRSEIRNPK